jgi:hypothetical protein
MRSILAIRAKCKEIPRTREKKCTTAKMDEDDKAGEK